MNISRFVSIHMRKNEDKVKLYIHTYENSRDHNFLSGILHSTPYMWDMVKYIQAEKAGIIHPIQAHRFKADFSKAAVYKSLKAYMK